MKRAWPRSTAVVLFGVILSAFAVYVGWQLPHREECRGDTCRPTPAIDWSLCVTADGIGTVLESYTYEELRERAIQRRIGTIM